MDIGSMLGTLSGSGVMSALAGASGSDARDVGKVLTAALPTLLDTLGANAKDSKKSASLDKALSDHSKKSVDEVTKNLDLADGAKIIGHILGSAGTADIKKNVSESTGISADSVGTILSAAAPVLMNLLGAGTEKEKKAQGGGFDLGSALGGLLGSGSVDLGSLVGGLLGDGDDKQTKSKGSKSAKEDGGLDLSDVVSALGGLLGGKDDKQTKSKGGKSAKEDGGLDLGDVVGALGGLLGGKK